MLPEELVKLIATVMDEEQAADIRILEVAELTVLADYFLIATGKNSHHIKSISDAVSARTKAAAIPVLHSDGYEESHWVILDFGSVIAHIFRQQERDYYRLEQLWGEAKAT